MGIPQELENSTVMTARSTQTSSFVPLDQRTVGEIRRVIRAEGPGRFDDRGFGNISTDSRTIAPGEFFLALRGEQFDGHAYIPRAVERGAGGLIVETGFEGTYDDRMPVLRVADPLRAFGDIAAELRRSWGGPVIALSGSVGKTTTRRLIAHGLKRHRNTLEPIRNFNNLIGVPTTLLRLEASHEVMIAELGINQPGELDRLMEIVQPNVAGLTRLGPTHVGMFGTLEALLEAKFAMFRCSPPGAVFVINAACPYSARGFEKYRMGHRLVTFRGEGDEEADYRIENAVPLESGGYRFDLVWPDGEARDARIEAFGRHLLEDIAAAAAFLGAGGYDPRWAVESLGDFQTEPLRGQILHYEGRTLILDCYNAAPGSMMSGLRTLGETQGSGRTVLVLADMLELGDFAADFHDQLREPIRGLSPAHLLSLGEQFGRLSAELRAEGVDARNYPDRSLLIADLKKLSEPGDRIFFKGSRRFELEKVASAIAGEIPGWGRGH